MKKIVLFILMCLSLSACNTNNISSSITTTTSEEPSSTTTTTTSSEKIDYLKQYYSSFQANTIIKSSAEGSEDIFTYYQLYVDDTHFTFSSYEDANYSVLTRQIFYELEDNKIINKTLNINNEIVSNQDTNRFLTDDFNLIDNFGLQIYKDGTYDVANNDVGALFNKYLTYDLVGTLSAKSYQFILNNNTLQYISIYESNGITLTIETTFLSKEEEKRQIIEPLKETEISNDLESLFTRLKDNNYTITIKENENIVKTLLINNDKIYVDNVTTSDDGYRKIENGYNILSIDDDQNVTLVNTVEEDFNSLLANFNFSSSIFISNGENIILPTYIDKDALIDELTLLNVSDFIYSINLSFSYDENSFTISSESFNQNEYKIIFNNINSTVIDIDLDDYDTKMGWENESSELYSFIVDMIGDINLLPYLDTGYGYNYYDYTSGVELDICSEDVPDSELDNLFTQYEQLLFETGYKKLTSDEIDEYGIFVWADSNDVANVYMINDTFAIEVYAFGYEGMFAGFNLFIYAI